MAERRVVDISPGALNTSGLGISRKLINRLTERLQRMGGLRHRVAYPVGSGGRASKEYLPIDDQDEIGLETVARQCRTEKRWRSACSHQPESLGVSSAA